MEMGRKWKLSEVIEDFGVFMIWMHLMIRKIMILSNNKFVFLKWP